jgi:hypothetical protein
MVMATTIIATSLACVTTAKAERFEDLQLVYHATFANGSLESAVDPLNIGVLQLGNSGEAGIDHSWVPSKGDYLVTLTRPASLTGPAVLAGIDATPVNFNVGSVVGLRGTFIAPTGPHNSTDIWAIALAVAPGGANPLVLNPSASATFQVRGAGARFNTPGASVPANLPNVPQSVFDAIFDPVDPQPFILELLVDRKTGRGEASLKVGEAVFSRTYEFAVFKADSGPAITDVGVHIGIINSSGQPVSVRIRDFQIFTSKQGSDAGSDDSLCPSEFGCRLVPTTER